VKEAFLINPVEYFDGTKIDIPAKGKYLHGRVKSPKAFDKRSFRLKSLPKGVKLTIACPKGKWDPSKPKGRECKVGSQTQSVMFPKSYPGALGKVKSMVRKFRGNPGAAWHGEKLDDADIDIRETRVGSYERAYLEGKMEAHEDSIIESKKLGINPFHRSLAVSRNPRRKEVKKKSAKRLPGKFSKARRHRPVLYEMDVKQWSRSPKAKSVLAGIRVRNNPLGESLIIAGSNPMKNAGTRAGALKAWRKRHGYRDNVWFGARAGHSKAAKKGWRGRRNPPGAGILTFGGFDFVAMLPLITTGALSATATVSVPAFLPFTMQGPFFKFGAQAATVIGGGMLVGMVLDRRHATVWTLTGGAVILADLLREWVFKPMGLLSDYDVTDYEVSQDGNEEVEAFPGEEVSAFPGEEVSGYPETVSHGSPY